MMILNFLNANFQASVASLNIRSFWIRTRNKSEGNKLQNYVYLSSPLCPTKSRYKDRW